MCGRYYVDDEMVREIEKLVRQIDINLKSKEAGDVYPSRNALVMTEGTDGLTGRTLCWGFPGFEKNKVIFNARSETALEKRMFRDSLLSRRCIVPARGFYEWNKAKEKYAFTRPDHKLLFFAGFYRPYHEGERFVILTTQANASMKQIHDRMPLIVEEDQIEDWILQTGDMEEILHQNPVMLESTTEYGQQTLDLY